MSFFQLWFLGFACSMALCAWTFRPYWHNTTTDLIAMAIGAMVISATWPLTLVAILVAVNEE